MLKDPGAGLQVSPSLSRRLYPTAMTTTETRHPERWIRPVRRHRAPAMPLGTRDLAVREAALPSVPSSHAPGRRALLSFSLIKPCLKKMSR